MNILAIDHGKKNIGLAWVDTALGVVLPYGRLETGDWRLDLVKLIEKENISTVIIGLPFAMDGGETEHTMKIRKFGSELESLIDIPIEYVDERFTSQQGDSMGGDVSRDEKAAIVMLQSYLEKIK